jgi:hypothetical protein
MPRSVISLLRKWGAELKIRRYFFCEQRLTWALAGLLWVILSAPSSFAHKGHSHGSQVNRVDEHSTKLRAAIGVTAANYEANVKRLFQRSCYDCHSSHTKYPWYSSLPWIKGLIEGDISEARTHLDLSDGYPFKGHGNLVSDLEAIRDAIRENSMPPSRYKVMHWRANLSQSEKDIIFRWVDEALVSIRSVREQKK